MKLFLVLAWFISLAIGTSAVLGQAPSPREAEAILNKLEGSLQGQHQADSGETLPVYTYKKGTSISGKSEGPDFSALNKLVSELESQIDALAASVQETKQQVIDDATVDNFITIEAALGNADHAALKNITVKLDGYSVYEVNDATGLWMPSRRVPLYAGPVKPGAHRLDVEARVVMKHRKSLPLNSDVYRLVSKTFEITVPDGTVNKTYRIELEPPQSVEQGMSATLKVL